MGADSVRLPYFAQLFLDRLCIDTYAAERMLLDKVETDPATNTKNPLPSSYLSGSKLTNVTSRLDAENISWSVDGMDRLYRSHGHTLEEIHNLRNGKWGRIPDIVIWVKNTENALSVVSLAKEFNLAIIPYGGGTTVSSSLNCDQNELRPIISLDTSQMVSHIRAQIFFYAV